MKPVEKLKETILAEKAEFRPTHISLPESVVKKVATVRITYKIQIAASKVKLKESKLRNLFRGKDKVTRAYDGEWYRYTIGEYESLEDAIYYKDRSGVEKSFIVSFENDTRRKIIWNYNLCNN